MGSVSYTHLHAQFLTLVDIRRSLHTMENRSQHLSGLHAVFLIIAPPRYDPRQIMIIPKEAVPAASLQFLSLIHI